MNKPLVRHVHSQCHVLLKVEGHDTQFEVAGRQVALTDSDAVLINAGEQHSYAHRPGQPPSVILALYIEPGWLANFRSNWKASGGPGFFPRASGTITARMRRETREIAEAMIFHPGEAALHERMIGNLMVSVIERLALWREDVSIRDLTAGARVVDPRVLRALRLVREDPGGITSMDALARESGLSRAHFFRLFETTTGVSPRVYLNMIRLERAVQEVACGERSFAAISDDLGFSVPAHFSRFFHDHAGSSPSTFRIVSSLSGLAFETPR